MKKTRIRSYVRVVVLLLLLLAVGWVIAGAFARDRVKETAIRCRDAIEKEDWATAATLAEDWARQAPHDSDAWISLADIAKAQGDFDATAESLRRVPATDPRYVNLQLLRADLLLNALYRPFDAVVAWQDVLKVEPTHPVPHQRILYVYSMTLQRQKLAAQIREAIHQRAEPPEAYGYLLSIPNLMFTDGYVRVEKWLKANPEDETLQAAYAVFRERSSRGNETRDFGVSDSKTSQETPYQLALKKYPQNLELLAYQIDDIIARADMSALGQALQNLPEEAENDSRFWRFIAAYQDSQQQTEEAGKSLHRAIELHPLDWKAHHELGAIERALGNPEVAGHHSELGARGKALERRFFELPNASQADPQLLNDLLLYAKDCQDADAIDGLTHRLQEQPAP